MLIEIFIYFIKRTIVNRLRLDKLEVIRTTKYSTKTPNKIENPGVICFSCITKSYSNLDEKQNIIGIIYTFLQYLKKL